MELPNFAHESSLWTENKKYVVGIDETGYGSAVGSLCVAGVMFPPDMSEKDLPAGLRDSKKLSPTKREKMFDEIMNSAISVKVVFGTAEEIDSTNVLTTNMKCMESILKTMEPAVDFALIDGCRKPSTCTLDNSKTIIGGDNISASIAAASVVAKVTRDNYVKKLVEDNPELLKYGIDKNMGYLSAGHRRALDEYGRTPFHRQSYKYKWQQKKMR